MSHQLPEYVLTNQIPKDLIDKLKGVYIMLGTPMYGGQNYHQYAYSVSELCKLGLRVGTPITTQLLANESLVQRARNRITNAFMRSSKCTHLLFIDSDIGFNPIDIFAMLACDKDIIGGAYPKKEINWNGVRKAIAAGVPNEHLDHCTGAFFIRPIEGMVEVKPFELLKVRYLGTGFMLIRKTALEKMKPVLRTYQPNSSPKDKGLTDTEYFNCDIVKNEYLSEDFWFCEKALEAGLDLWFAPWIQLNHTGTYTYRGCFFCSQGQYIHNIGVETTEDPKVATSPEALLQKIKEGK